MDILRTLEWPRLIDLPLHSETFFEAGMRATQARRATIRHPPREALKGELGHIHELKGVRR